MPMRRLGMRKVREILRLKWDCKLSERDIARSCSVSRSSVKDCIARARASNLSWPLPEELDDATLETRLYTPLQPADSERVMPNFELIHENLKQRGVTLQLLWQEYRQVYGDKGYQYSRFTVLYRQWAQKLDVVMRQIHRPGEKMFVDFAGQTLPLADPATGEVSALQIFVATLGASNYTYAEAMPDQTSESWINGHIRAFLFFDGVAAITVPDNLKAGVSKACRYEPDINPVYTELAIYYDTAVVPARVRKPRDKAKVENGVQQVERWVLAPLRNHTFFSIHEANAAIFEQLKWLNHRPLSNSQATRHSLYLKLDKPALKPLPKFPFELSDWKCNVGVNIDYHVAFDNFYYSVPYQLVHKRVDIRSTSLAVECFYKGQRVAAHYRRYAGDRYVTDPAHRPKSHQRYAEWSPSRLVAWGQTIGPATSEVIQTIMERKPHPEQGYRSCLGIIRLAKKYTPVRLEAACSRACEFKTFSYKSVASMLRTGMDKVPVNLSNTNPILPNHSNIRGPAYYKG